MGRTVASEYSHPRGPGDGTAEKVADSGPRARLDSLLAAIAAFIDVRRFGAIWCERETDSECAQLSHEASPPTGEPCGLPYASLARPIRRLAGLRRTLASDPQHDFAPAGRPVAGAISDRGTAGGFSPT